MTELGLDLGENNSSSCLQTTVREVNVNFYTELKFSRILNVLWLP